MRQIKVYKGYVQLVETLQEVERFLESLEDGSLLTFDWETTGLDYQAIPLVLSLHQRGKDPHVIPFDFFFTNGLPLEKVVPLLNKHYARLRLIAHNAKYDTMINVMNGILDENVHIAYDTIIMVHLVDPALDMKLEERVKEDFGYEKPTFGRIIRDKYGLRFDRKWADIDWAKEGDELLPLLAGYAGEDTFWTTKVFYKYKDLMDKDAWRIHDKIELPLIKILRDAKIRGVLIDVPLLKEMEKRATAELGVAMQRIYEEAGCEFNINSVKQKREVFFDRLHLPVIGSTRTGEPATNSDAFETWAEMGFPIGEALVAYSELQKLLSGYIIAIPNLVDEHNVLRGDLNSCGTRTGRMSSSNPNLQNQPNNHDFPIRDAFIPRPGYCFINYDYSQLELRVMAHMSKDAKFMQIFHAGRDPHGEVAQQLGITRKRAKTCNFGVLYGLGIPNFAHNFGVSEEEAKRIIDDYHTTYDGFARWKTATENFAKKNGYVKNLFGRIRILSEAAKSFYKDMVDKRKYFGELRQSVNTIIQGTGADIVKRATIAMCNEFERRNLDAHFLLQVHDEVLIEARIDQAREVERIVIDTMQNTTKLDVPLLADGKILAKWGEMKDEDVPSLFDRFDYSTIMSLM